MLRIASLYGAAFVAVGLVNFLLLSMGTGAGATVHPGLAVALFVLGAICGVVAERPFRT